MTGGVATRRVLLWVTCAAVLVAAGCAAAPTPQTSTPQTPAAQTPAAGAPVTSSGVTSNAATAPPLPACTGKDLPTRTAGVLTLATAAPLATPWFSGGDPATSKGYEADIAHAVAATLGFPVGRQKWVTVDKAAALAGTDRSFDVFLDQVSDSDLKGAAADYSSGYYGITDALLVRNAVGAQVGHAPAFAALRVGVLGESTGQQAVADRGAAAAPTFPTAAALAAALRAGTVDAGVLPTPDALRVAQLDPAVTAVGQLAGDRFQPDQFHLVLPRHSALTPCISAAVDRLRIDGTLKTLTARWITLPTLN